MGKDTAVVHGDGEPGSVHGLLYLTQVGVHFGQESMGFGIAWVKLGSAQTGVQRLLKLGLVAARIPIKSHTQHGQRLRVVGG